MHNQNSFRVQQICLLTLLPGLCFIIGAHAAVEQQRALFQDLTHITHGEFSFSHKNTWLLV